MDSTRFGIISRLFAQRRTFRLRAQDATSQSTPRTNPADHIAFLFVQSFEGGTIAPKQGEDGAFIVTLEHGLGQTLYFSDRPHRIAGAVPTSRFLDGLGFSPDNPPNAALLIDSDDGDLGIAVVELTNPTYDATSSTATYDIALLANYASTVHMHVHETPTDLEWVASSFGTAHLFIDDCPDMTVTCGDEHGYYVGVAGVGGTCWSWSRGGACYFCEQGEVDDRCNRTFPQCNDKCQAVAT